MKIQVRLYANLKAYSPQNESVFDLVLNDGATIKNLIETLKIPDRVNMVLIVNGRMAKAGRALKPNDTVTFFPPMEGG